MHRSAFLRVGAAGLARRLRWPQRRLPRAARTADAVAVYKPSVHGPSPTTSKRRDDSPDGPPPPERASTAHAESDDAFLDRLQRTAFDYFRSNQNPDNGLVADTTRPGAPSSIAVVGFALSAFAVGVERGWMARADAAACALKVLRFFAASDQSGSAAATGYRGFYYHFLDMESGRRMWASEVSLIDTALLIAGMLTARAYFDGDSDDEVELRRLAET